MTLRQLAALALVLLPTLQAPGASARTYTLTGDDVRIWNPAGEVRIEPATGGSVAVDVTLAGRDAGELQVSGEAIGGHPTLRILYPDGPIVYPAMGRWSNTSSQIGRDGTWGGGSRGMNFFGRRITVKGGGNGTEAWADLVVRVPRGRTVSVYTLAGGGEIRNVDGNLRFDGGSGGVTASGCRGDLTLDVGSGGIEVSDFTGDLNVDTGSGGIRAYNVSGPSVRLDTGSGGVTGSGIVTDDLWVDTGSGSVELDGVDAKKVRIDTGSGGVRVAQLNRSPEMMIDTGSGSVRVTVPSDFSARVHVETGSGGIRSELPLAVAEKDHGILRGTIGGGVGRLTVDTGSGGVSVLASGTATRARSR
jgi:DUF4097 and DUF4098 domain-containing protein YvlB